MRPGDEITEWIGPARVVFWPPEGSGTEQKMLLARLPSPWEVEGMEDPYALLLNAPDIQEGTSGRAFDTREEAVAFIEWVLDRFSGAREDGLTAGIQDEKNRQTIHGLISAAEAAEFLMAPLQSKAEQ